MLGGRLGPANGSDVMAQGVAIDLQRGTLLTINACGRRRVHFTFGNLLTVCDDGKFEIFRDLWREQARLVAATAPYQSKWQDACRTRVLAHFDDGDDDYVWFSLYLTPEGLAVHNVFALGALERGCVSDPDSPFFPVIIPWRKLSSLMNAGPLRDELLADR